MISNQTHSNPFFYSLIGVFAFVLILDFNLTSEKHLITIILIFLIFFVIFSMVFYLLVTNINKFIKNYRERQYKRIQENKLNKLKQDQENKSNKLKQDQENKLTQYLLKINEQQKQYILKFAPYLSSSRKFSYTDYTGSYSDEKYALEYMIENKVFQLINEEEDGCEYNDYTSYILWELKLTEEAIRVIDENNLMEKWRAERIHEVRSQKCEVRSENERGGL